MRVHLDGLPPPLRRESSLVALTWSAIGLIALVQAIVLSRVNGATDITVAVLNRVSIIPLWALATPLVLRSARRWPLVTQPPTSLLPVNLLRHVAFGSGFVVTANFAIQLPLLPTGTDFVASAIRDIAENYPAALVVYLVLVALGHIRVSKAQSSAPGCLTIRQWNRVHFVRFDDIDWIAAEDNYVVVHAGGRSYKGRERISDVASQLDTMRFVRIHRSTIVHVSKIREVQPLSHGDHAVILRDGTQLRASRSRREALSNALDTTL